MSNELTVPIVIGWDASHLAQAAVQVKSCVTILEGEALSAQSKIRQSADYYKGEAGDAARVRGDGDKTEIFGTSETLSQLAEKISSLAESIATNISNIKSGIEEVESSRWDLFVQDNGEVDCRKSNLEISSEHEPFGAAAVAAKEFMENQYTAQIKGALDNIKRDDLEGGEQVARFLEMVPASTREKIAASPYATDPKLRQILLDYQTDASSQTPELWPTGIELELIRAVKPDFNPSVMTPEEIDSMKDLLLSGPDGPLKVWEHANLTEDAKTTAETDFYNTKDDGQGDAFRHAYWNARMTQEFGAEWTETYATAHEKTGGNIPQREAMDLYNNQRGREIALANPDASPEELKQIIKDELSKGTLVVLEGKDNTGNQHSTTLAWSNIPESSTRQAPGVGLPLPGKK